MRQFIQTLFIAIIILVFTATVGFCAGKGKDKNGNKGKGKGKQEQVVKSQKNNNGHQVQAQNRSTQQRDKSAKKRVHDREQSKKNADMRASRPNREIQNHNDSPGAAVKEEKLAKLTQRQRHERPMETPKEKVERFKGILNALEHARWSNNPHDDRGQGNMGKPTMQDPFGFDKDSDRKELYGNNGRPIRTKDGDTAPSEDDGVVEEDVAVAEDVPVVADTPVAEDVAVEEGLPTEEDVAVAEAGLLDASIDFSSIDSMEWLVNWYESTVANYYVNESVQERYTYEEWDALWYNHFFPGGDQNTTTGIRLNNIGDTSERYNYDISLNNFEGDSVLVTTQMVLSEDYTSSRYYDESTGTWQYKTTEYQAGDVVFEQTGEMGVDSTTGAINVGISATDDMTGYSSSEVYIDMVVTVTDPSTGSTYTQSYDKALYLYRCPYGKIYNSKTSRPIVNAKVTVHFEDGSIVSLDRASNPTAGNPQTTDATGRYGFKLETNRKYFMTASADGYENYKSPIFTEKWHVLREDIALNPKIEEHLIGFNDHSQINK